MRKKYNDLELDYNLSLFSSNTIKFLKYALKDSKTVPGHDQYLGNKLLFKSRWLRFIDMCWCFVRFGAPTNYYKFFEFYKYNNAYRDTFLTSRRLTALIQKRTNLEAYFLFDDKAKFNKAYARFMKRKWMTVDNETTVDRLQSFLNENGRIIVKPIDSHQGMGVFVVDKGQEELLESVAEKAKNGERFICEEVVENISCLREVNPSSLNTMRINTFIDKAGNVVFLGNSLRAGAAGSPVDNLHGGGVMYHVNERGFIDQCGYDSNRGKHYFHPSTNKKMIGMEIPMYDELMKYMVEVASVNKNAKLIGWDVAITENGFELIEGNFGPDECIMQDDGVGRYRYIIENW